MDKKNDKNVKEKELSATEIMGQPENSFELVNKYGTYEIQPTNDSDNIFPTISQGLSRMDKNQEINKEQANKQG